LISSRQIVLKSRFGRLSFAIFILTILFGFFAAPQALAAQAAKAAPTEKLEAGPHSDVLPNQKEKSEDEERQEYRHSATVRWIANLFHVDVETAATTLEYINFGIVVVAIGIPLFRILPKAMRQRTARLNFDLEVAKAKSEDANARLKAVEDKLAGLDAEIAELRKQMEADMVTDEARSKALIEEETARIVAAAEQEIVVAGAQARRGLKQFAGDLAIDRALSRLTLNAETDRALFAEFATDVVGKPKRSRSKGEQN
jgi:F-type H+-transporting ATPase subunit b